MSDGWLAGYEHVPVLGCTGPGTMVDGYAWRFILHTTQSPAGSMDGILDLFRGKPCYAPQFVYDPGRDDRPKRFAQLIPWTWSGCALRGGRDGLETNRARSVQLEVCGYAEESPDWPDWLLSDVAAIIADVIRDGCPIDPTVAPDYRAMTGVLATEDAPQRLRGDDWRLFPGIGAHVIAPYQDHWDAGRCNGPRISELVLEHLGEPPQPARPVAPAPPPSRPVATGTIARGMRGGIVTFAQELLIGLGYDCGPYGADGDFGPATELAVRRFQGDHGLAVDGIIGPQTEAAVAAAYGNGPGVVEAAPPWPGRYLLLRSPMLAGPDVSAWQQRANVAGFGVGPVDGFFGPRSRAGCIALQTARRLTVDGVVGPVTWAATWA